MAKRDIRIDYDCLAVVERQLKKQRNALEKLRTAMGKADSAVSAGNTAKSIDGLKKRYKKAKKRLDDCYGEVDALYGLIHGYIRDMTGIIQPKRGKTRVGRNDIYMNLQSVKHGIDDIRDVQDSCFLFSSSGMGKTEEEKRKMERNYEKIETQAWGRLFPKMRRTVEESRRKLQGYYDHEIKDYENKDDEYKRKSEKVRYRYSSPWELFKQNTIDTVSFAWSIVKGAGMAGLDLLKGFYSIGNMIYYGVSADVAAIVYLVSSDPPEWTEEVLGESEEYFGNIVRAISHPVETVEAMAQSANDTYEEEGLTYMVSYVVADIAIGKAAAGKYSKVKAADKADDVADVAKVTNKADDVADVSKAADKADDVADVADTTSKADDIADVVENPNNHYDDFDNLDDLEDFYDDVYDQYYKDQFDPVEEGAIADLNDIDDAANVSKATNKASNVKKVKGTDTPKKPKKVSAGGKKKYLETIDDLIEKMKKDGVSKDVSYEELVAKYGDRYYKKELEAAYAKYTKKTDQLSNIDYKKILKEAGKPVKEGEHAHHIVYKKGLPGKMREIVKKAQDILYKYDIDPITDPHNLVSAPNKGHSIKNIQEVYDGLAKAEKKALEYCKEKGMSASATKKYVRNSLYDELEDLGKIAARR